MARLCKSPDAGRRCPKPALPWSASAYIARLQLKGIVLGFNLAQRQCCKASVETRRSRQRAMNGADRHAGNLALFHSFSSHSQPGCHPNTTGRAPPPHDAAIAFESFGQACWRFLAVGAFGHFQPVWAGWRSDRSCQQQRGAARLWQRELYLPTCLFQSLSRILAFFFCAAAAFQVAVVEKMSAQAICAWLAAGCFRLTWAGGLFRDSTLAGR